MAIIGKTLPTLLDIATRAGADGKVQLDIVEILNEVNEPIEDIVFMEANEGTTHKTTIRSGLPEATWRLLNYGVQPSKSQTVQVKDSTGMLEAYAEIDKALADLNGNTQAFRLTEDRAFIEGMGQSFIDTLFYGDTTVNPERFTGFAPRFNSLSAANKGNIIDAGGTGTDNVSMWVVTWGPTTVHGLYPKGSVAGLQARDLGEQTLFDAAGGRFQGYRTHYKWDAGLTVRDWRYVVRICNIDLSDLKKDAATGADLVDLLTQGIELIPNTNMGKTVIYANRTIRSYLRRQIRNAKNVHITMEEVGGRKVVAFDGIPVRRCDALVEEARVV